MPTITKTLTGPSKASKYPYRYQQDVKDRNDFRLKMKAELKAMARESFLEEMEKIRTLGLGNSGMVSAGSGLDSNPFDITGNSNMSRFQRIVTEMQYQHGAGPNRNTPLAMQLESSSSMIHNQGPSFSVMDSNMGNNNNYSAEIGGFLTARTDPGQSIGKMSPPQLMKKKQQTPGSTKNNDIPEGQMFVLSSAPINSHEKLVHSKIQQANSIPLETSSLLEQANRYTEMQSLFQPPTMSHELLESSIPSIESEFEVEKRLQQLRAQQQQQRQKLETTVTQHKDRLIRSRQQERYDHSGLLAKSATSTKPTAPKSYQHNRGRRIIDTQSQPQSQHKGFTTSPYDTHSRSNSPQHHVTISYPPHSPSQPSGYLPFDVASTVGILPTTLQSSSPVGTTMNNTNNRQNNNNHSNSNNSLLTTDFMSFAALHTGAVAPPPSAVHIPFSSNNSIICSTNAVSTAHPQTMSDMIMNMNANQLQQPPLSLTTPLQSTQDIISVDDFQKKTEQLDNDLKAIVRNVVHNEMLTDGRAQHYTKRFMTKMMKDKEASLVDRIEQAVGEKIQSLQQELATLKAKKLRRFKRNNNIKNSNNATQKGNNKRNNNCNTATGKNVPEVNDNSFVEDGLNDDGSFFGGYYDIDDDELPNWLKNSGEILHVLERTHMNNGTPSDPNHIDIRTLNTEINRAIEMTLRRLLTGKHSGPELYHNNYYPAYPDRIHTEASSTKLGGAANSEKSISDVGKTAASAIATGSNVDASSALTGGSAGGSKVHGRIETGKDTSKATDGYGDFDKVATTTTSASAVMSSASVDLPTSIKAKKKSKAEKLLGLDGPPGGGPGGGLQPMDPSNASSRPGIGGSNTSGGGGLFGSIGNLFSSKPGNVGTSMSPSMSSTKPSMMMSMMSSRENTNNSNRNISIPPVALSSMRPGVGRHSMMAPIIDEGDEEASQKSSPNKSRPSPKSSDSSNRKLLRNTSGSMKKKKGHDSSDQHDSESMTSLHSKVDNGATNNMNNDETEAAGDENAESADKTSGRLAVDDPPMNLILLAELSKEESQYRELMQNLLGLAEVKVNIKRELKDWEKQFTMKFGREPSAEDKATINDRYIAYKLATTQVQEAKDHVRACEDKLKEIRDRAAAEQQQQLD